MIRIISSVSIMNEFLDDFTQARIAARRGGSAGSDAMACIDGTPFPVDLRPCVRVRSP